MSQRLHYNLKGISSFRKAFSVEFVKLSINYSQPRKLNLPSSLTLWTKESVGVRIFSKMIDIGKFKKGRGYLEEGILTLEKVVAPLADEIIMNLPNSFKSGLKTEKYVMYFSDLALDDEVELERTEVEYECGVRLTSSTGDVIEILPNAHPYMLAVNCSFHALNAFDHNYDLKIYRVEEL